MLELVKGCDAACYLSCVLKQKDTDIWGTYVYPEPQHPSRANN